MPRIVSTVAADDAAEQPGADAAGLFTFELPARRDDAPPPRGAARRIALPDGRHWVEARGGGTQAEGRYLNFLHDRVRRAVTAHEAGELDEDGLREAEMAFNAGLATFLADRVVAHNLTYADGVTPLPLGLDLFWELPGGDAMHLCWRIQSTDSVFADPNGAPSTTDG